MYLDLRKEKELTAAVHRSFNDTKHLTQLTVKSFLCKFNRADVFRLAFPLLACDSFCFRDG
ncbi:hypothetical protein [Paenibacillus tianmuensis]|uniref:hypothetical protein n=1 Tax=Paenibacillus tianmuensis TaxID=624147 RepID=UPI001FDEA375|nr:hypothetical protein [Paenibacillus tianmuensis]